MTPGSDVLEATGRLLEAWAQAGWPTVDRARLGRTAIRAGVPLETALRAAALLETVGMIKDANGVLAPSEDAKSIGDDPNWCRWNDLAVALLKSEPFHGQALRLVATGVKEGGELRVHQDIARHEGPQAAPLLAWISGERDGWLPIPSELLAAAVLRDPVEPIPPWIEDQAFVGKRAEQYSLLRETLGGDGHVLYVASERDDAGYDIEVIGPEGSRYIEVKGARSRKTVFHLSLGELREAERKAERFEIHFWGGIDLSSAMPHEYARLVAEGYPLVYPNLARHLHEGDLVAEPDGYEVRPKPARGPGALP